MITIIVTAYNVGKTIAKAILSCLNLSYKNLEILVINDCSTDNTLDVLNTFEDSRLRVITNTENVGAGMSRRIGTKEAKGEYTTFLDGDDYINPDYIETLYNLAIKYNALVVSSGLRIVESGHTRDLVYDKEEALDASTFRHFTDKSKHLINIYLNTKLVARSIWGKVEYSNRRYIEDTLSCFFVLYFADKVVTTPYVGYNYVLNISSLCHTATEIKLRIYRTLCAKDICEFLALNNDEETSNALLVFCMRFKEIGDLNLPDSIKEEFKDELAEICTFFLQNVTF